MLLGLLSVTRSLIVLLVLTGLCAVVSTVTAFAAAPTISSEGRFVWEPELHVLRAERIFPNPHEPRRVWVATARGIMETRDEGGTWDLLPNTGPDQLGRVSDVLFAPLKSQLAFLASRERGIFRSMNGGKTWQNVGTPASGVKSLQVLRLACDANDRGSRIFYATHGDGATGISKTIDGGDTWFSIGEHFFAHEILLEAKEVLVSAHPREEEDIWGIYHSLDSGETWAEIVRDVRPTAAGLNRIKYGGVWFGILKGRLLHRPHVVKFEVFPEWQQAGPPKNAQWTSIFGAFGRSTDDDVLYAYDPRQYGLIASRDDFKTWWPENTGLFDEPLVKEGANVCASADGKVLYASINGQLYVGRSSAADGPVIASFAIAPNVVKWAKDGQIQFAAKVLPFDKDPKSKIKLVQVNLSALRGPGNFTLFDDGKHNDGAADDGVFSGTFAMGQDFPAQGQDRRLSIPGEIMVQVCARDDKNRLAADVVPLHILPKPESFVYWDGETVRWGGKLADGCRSAYSQRYDDRNGIVNDVESEARTGKRCLHVYSARGPWVSGWGSSMIPGRNVTDMDYVSFWIKGQVASKRDVRVMLSDSLGGDQHQTHVSSGVWLIKEGYLQELRTDYQQVRIPIAKFLKKTEFLLDVCGGIAFGGDDPRGHNFYVDDICIEVEGSLNPAPPPPRK